MMPDTDNRLPGNRKIIFKRISILKINFKLLILIILLGFTSDDKQPSEKFHDITDDISPESFNRIKNFILEKGDRKFYCSMYNNNPHFYFGTFHAYLNPDTGQKNINCDLSLSDFNELVIHDPDSEIQYLNVVLIKNINYGENIQFKKIPGMTSGHVYLLNEYSTDLKTGRKALLKAIKKISETIK